MAKKRKISDDTFFVTRRMGRILGNYSVFRDGGRVGVGVSGGVASSILLYLLHLRHGWVPVRTELVPLHVGTAAVPDKLTSVATRIDVECQVIEATEDITVLDHLLEAAAQRRLDAIVLGDVIEDRAASVLGSLVFDGELTALPQIVEAEGRPTLVRPFAMLPEAAVLRAAADNGIEGRPPTHGRNREWMERLLAEVPGDRQDLLTNLAKAPDRIRKDYLV